MILNSEEFLEYAYDHTDEMDAYKEILLESEMIDQREGDQKKEKKKGGVKRTPASLPTSLRDMVI